MELKFSGQILEKYS